MHSRWITVVASFALLLGAGASSARTDSSYVSTVVLAAAKDKKKAAAAEPTPAPAPTPAAEPAPTPPAAEPAPAPAPEPAPAEAAPAKEQPAAEGAEEESELPDGCSFSFLCFKPPADEISHPALKEKKIMLWLIYALVPGIGTLLGPFWLLPDNLYIGKDYFVTMVINSLLPMAFFVPAMCCGMILYVGWPCAALFFAIGSIANIVWAYYIGPVTLLHALNRSMIFSEKPGAKEADD